MHLRSGILAAAAGVALALTLAISMAAAPAPQSPTPEEIIAARQASLDLSVMAMAEMRRAVKDSADVKKQAYPANSLLRWAKVLPTLFPAGTEKGAASLPTKARSEIWTD